MLDPIQHFLTIKSTIERFDRRALSIEIIKLIRIAESKTEQKVPEPPFLWNLLFLLKSAAGYGTFAPDVAIRNSDLAFLHNLCLDLADFVPPETTQNCPQDVVTARIMRGMANQQFWMKGGLNALEIGRALLIAREYTKIGGLSFLEVPLESFLKNALILYIWQLSHPRNLIFPPRDPEVIMSKPTEYKTVLNSITLDLSDYRRSLESSFAVRSPRLQIFEPSVFYRFPVLRINGSHYVVSVQVLRRTISYYIFDRLSHVSQESRRHLAKAFENYGTTLVRETNSNALTEDQIRAEMQVPNHDSCIDLMAQDDSTVLLIEFKAVISRGIARVLPSRENSITTYRDTVVKGFAQGFQFARRISDLADKITFLIVTLEELHLSNTQTLFSDFIADALSINYPGLATDTIPVGNIFVVSISDLEYLVGLSVQRKISIPHLLSDLRHGKEQYTLFSYLLNEHLQPGFNVPIVSDASNALFQEVIAEAKDVLGQ